MKLFGNIVLAIVVVVGIAGAVLLFRPLVAEHGELSARLDALAATNEQLRVEINDLKVRETKMEDPSYAELEARRRGLSRKSEAVFDFSEPGR